MADEQIDFEPSSLTLDEAEQIEDIAERPVGDILVGLMRGRFGAKDLKAIATVMKRREDPDFTVDQLDGDMHITGMLTSVVTSGILADATDESLDGPPRG